MCLSSRITRKAQRESVAKLPEWITVWKIFRGSNYNCIKRSAQWRGEMFGGAMGSGIHNACESVIKCNNYTQRYKAGFHCFATRKGAVSWYRGRDDRRIVPCKIRPEWITAIGIQSGHPCHISNKIKIPSPKQYFKTHK